jgi:hypothetical protein
VTAPHSLRAWLPADLPDLVRLGRAHDGGYVVSEASIAAADVVVGLGISDDWSFEADVAARRPGLRIVAVDGSVSAAVFCRRAVDSIRSALGTLLRWDLARGRRSLDRAAHAWRTARRFRAFFGAPGRVFLRRYLGAGRLGWAELARDALRPGERVFLKIDIEGAEYDLVPEIVADHARITGCAIEFHDCGARWAAFAGAMDQLSGPFVVAHLHGNNWAPLVPGSALPSVMEVSFVNRSLLSWVPGPITPDRLPRPALDMPSRAGVDEYRLPL